MPRLDTAEIMEAVGDISLDLTAGELKLFAINPGIFETMDEGQRIAITSQALGLTRDLSDAAFKASQAGWLMIGSVPPIVVEAGTGPEPVSDEEITEVSQRIGSVVFFVLRPDNSGWPIRELD